MGLPKYGYNDVNLMITLSNLSNVVTSYGYDNVNRKNCIIYPNGTGRLWA